MTGLPAGSKVELSTDGGTTWVDLTGDVDSYTVNVGRSSAFSACQPGALTVVLDNQRGAYTPGAALLIDGSANGLYPNIVPGKLLRASDSVGVQFLGKVDSWRPTVTAGGSGQVTVQAFDLLERLQRVKLRGPIAQEVGVVDSPVHYWPMTDPAGSLVAADQVGDADLAPDAGVPSSAFTFGGVGPGIGDGTGLEMTGYYLRNTALPAIAGACTVELFVQFTPPAAANYFLLFTNGFLEQQASGGVLWVQYSADNSTVLWTSPVSASITDGGWHHIALVDTGAQQTFYVDGVQVGTAAVARPAPVTSIWLTGGASPYFYGQVALHDVALSAGRIAVRTPAKDGFFGERLDLRIARVLGYAGVAAADRNLDVSTLTLNAYPQDGADVLSMVQDCVNTEGGGSAFYSLAGVVRFRNRAYRTTNTVPALTVDNVADGTPDGLQPSLDRDGLVNSQTVNRTGASGTQQSTTVTDPVSVALNDLRPGSDLASYAKLGSDHRLLAQWIVATSSQPVLRLPKVTLDLFTASAATLAAAHAAMDLGQRVRAASMPRKLSPASFVDGFVEAWSLAVSADSAVLGWDLSEADGPAFWVWGDLAYGRWQADSITAASALGTGSTPAFTVPAGKPGFTTDPSHYPFDVMVDAEVMTLTAPPAVAGTKASFAGVLRGQKGTTAAAHAAGAAMTLYPLVTWGL